MSTRFIIIIVTFIAILLILLGFYFLGRTKPIESFTCSTKYNSPNSNLVKHGSFDNQQHISNSKVGPGNDVITYPNPGDSSYVLRQSSQLSNCDDDNVMYKIRLSLNNTKTYRLSCWVCLSDDWNGNNYIFSLRIFNLNNDNTLKKSEGTQINSKKMYNILWTQFEYILELNQDDTGEVNWLLGFQPNNTEGYRYITGVSVSLFNPLLNDFKLTYGLELFTNTYQDSSYNSSGLIWKDLSNNGRDFQWSTMTSVQNDGGVNTSNLSIIGPKNSSLGINTSCNFTIMWLAKYKKKNKCTDGQNIYEIFSLYTQDNDLPYIRVAIDVHYQQFIITIGHITYPGISVGLCQSQSLYSLIKNGNRFFIRKDDIQLNSSELFIYQDSEKSSFSTQKNLIINPHKDLNSEIYAFLVYNYSLNCYEIDMVQSYLVSIKKSNNYDSKACCPSQEKESGDMTSVEDDFNIPDGSEDFLNQETEHYESKPFQCNYYNNHINIPGSGDNSSYQISSVSNNSKREIEHFVSSRRATRPNIEEEEGNKFSNLKKMLIEQNMYTEEEDKQSLQRSGEQQKHSGHTSRKNQLSVMSEEEQEHSSHISGKKHVRSSRVSEKSHQRAHMSEEEHSRPLPIPEESLRLSNIQDEEFQELFEEEYNSRPFPEKPLEKYSKGNRGKDELLLSQKLDESETSELYQDESNQSTKRAIAEETEQEIKKTNEPSRRESLKLKLKLLKEMIAEEEEEMIRNPLSKVKELIDTQGETVQEANYEPFEQDTCFNRVPQSNDPKCHVDMNQYMKKSDVDAQYISKTEVNKDYVKKDNIPCWGCNLK